MFCRFCRSMIKRHVKWISKWLFGYVREVDETVYKLCYNTYYIYVCMPHICFDVFRSKNPFLPHTIVVCFHKLLRWNNWSHVRRAENELKSRFYTATTKTTYINLFYWNLILLIKNLICIHTAFDECASVWRACECMYMKWEMTN